MTFTKEQLRIISEYPLADIVNSFRTKLRDSQEANNPRQEDIASLLSALVGSTAAFNLPSPDGSGNLAFKLFTIQQNVRGGNVKPDSFRSLTRCVIENESTDVQIWQAVLAIIESLDVHTPPSSIVPTFKGTPVKPSSSRLGDSETRDVVEGELFFEIRDCTFRNVGGFWDKFFDPKRWLNEQRAMLRALMKAHNGKRWIDFPNPSHEQPVWEWLQALEKDYLVDARHKLRTTKSAHQFEERKGQMDLFFQPATNRAKDNFRYKDVLVVGEQKKSDDKSRFKADLLQLTRHVRSVFADQPTRRFVHAFTLCASVMELWVFDRSGPYSSGTFDVHEEPDKFARALVGYATMDDDAMGLDTFIERKGGSRSITLDDTNGGTSKVQLMNPMVRQKAVVCRGTTCFMTRGKQVAKFSWASDKRELEYKQLKLAEERGVQGVAKAVAYRQITTIADLREDLVFPDRHRFRSDVLIDESSSATASTDSSSQKRKSSSDVASDDTSEPKRRRSNRIESGRLQTVGQQLSANKRKPSLYSTGEDPWDNRIYVCLVVSPAGRVISDFGSIKELLEAMRDAIRAHQSLFVTGNILHRDISSNNIIITNPETADSFKGMLIDLDLAKVADTGPSGARHRTGTMQFMAIEVLRQTDHTYRHDLESFFYVLLWMCARESWSKHGLTGGGHPPKSSLLRKWEVGSFRDIADAKEGHMTVNSLERIMGEFPQSLDMAKPLCLRIRSILFGDTARLHFGTPVGEPCKLYQPIIAAFNEALDKIPSSQ